MGALTQTVEVQNQPVPNHRENASHSLLDCFLDKTLGSASRCVGLSDESSKMVCDFGKSIGTKIPFFIPGRSGYVLTGLIGGLDEVSPDAAIGSQLVSAVVGGTRSCALKGLYTHMGSKEWPSATRGLVTGIASRGIDSLTHSSTYSDGEGGWNVYSGLRRTATDVFNPTAMATDVLIWGIADYVEGRLNLPTAGAFRRSPVKPMVLSAAVFGATESSLSEITRQNRAGENLNLANLGRIVGRGLLGAGENAICALPGAAINARYRALPKTAFNQSETVRPAKLDEAQIRLRDGAFELTRDLDPRSMKVKACFGKVSHADGTVTESIFRFNDGTEAFANRRDAEVAAYSFADRMGMKEVAPITVSREITINGVSHDGYMQEVTGRSLATTLSEMAVKRYGAANTETITKLLNESPALMHAIQKAMIVRQIAAEHDNHGQNFTIETKPDGSVRVTNVDLNFSYPEAHTDLDLIPRREKEVSVVDLQTGAAIRNIVQNTPIPKETHQLLADFSERYSNKPELLLDTGLNPKRIEGGLGRAQWFVENGTHPVSHPNYVWLSYVRYRALAVNKPQPDLSPPEPNGTVTPAPSVIANGQHPSLARRIATLPIDVMKLPLLRVIFP